MDTETLLRRNVSELRALLDLGYARERALATAANGLLFLLENAAVAPDRQGKVEEITKDAKSALELLTKPPIPNHGLLVEYARLSAERDGLASVNASLVRSRNDAQQVVASAAVARHEMHVRAMEAEAQRDALVALLRRPDLSDAVMAAARDLVRARLAVGTPS